MKKEQRFPANFAEGEPPGEIFISELNDSYYINFCKIQPGQARGRKSQVTSSYKVSNYTSFEIDLENLHVSFKSPNPSIAISFSFLAVKDLTDFLETLSDMVRIVHSQTKQSLYTLGSFDFGPSQTNITFLPRIRAATDLVSFQSIDQKLNFNTIDEQLIINSDNLAEVTSTPFKLYNAKIDDSVLFSVFQICYPKLDDLTLEYESIKKQWTLIFPKQLEKQQQLQKAIKLIESDILSNKYFEGNKKLQKTALNVLLTYSIYNNDGAFYYHNELEFLIPLLDAYVKQYGNDYDPSKCETELFNIYDSFYKFGKFDEYKNLKKQRFIKPMLVDLGSQLKNNFSEMVHFLQQRNIISLDFFISQIRNWFVEAFDLESIQRLWISIPHLENSFSQSSESSSPSLEKFFACFVTAILYLTEKEMIDIYPICENEFVEFFQNVLKKVDMNKLLCYAKRIYGFYFK